MRTELKVLRVKQKMTQAQFAEKLGVSRAMYSAIENGTRIGTLVFWENFSRICEIPEGELWKYTKNDSD